MFGGVAQLGEHYPCTVGVESSSLSVSTHFQLRRWPKGRSANNCGRPRAANAAPTVYTPSLITHGNACAVPCV